MEWGLVRCAGHHFIRIRQQLLRRDRTISGTRFFQEFLPRSSKRWPYHVIRGGASRAALRERAEWARGSEAA